MANSDMNLDQVLQTFILEARELLEDMEAALLRSSLPILSETLVQNLLVNHHLHMIEYNMHDAFCWKTNTSNRLEKASQNQLKFSEIQSAAEKPPRPYPK